MRPRIQRAIVQHHLAHAPRLARQSRRQAAARCRRRWAYGRRRRSESTHRRQLRHPAPRRRARRPRRSAPASALKPGSSCHVRPPSRLRYMYPKPPSPASTRFGSCGSTATPATLMFGCIPSADGSQPTAPFSVRYIFCGSGAFSVPASTRSGAPGMTARLIDTLRVGMATASCAKTRPGSSHVARQRDQPPVRLRGSVDSFVCAPIGALFRLSCYPTLPGPVDFNSATYFPRLYGPTAATTKRPSSIRSPATIT